MRLPTCAHERHEVFNRDLNSHLRENIDRRQPGELLAVTQHPVHVKQHRRHFPPVAAAGFLRVSLFQSHARLHRSSNRSPPT